MVPDAGDSQHAAYEEPVLGMAERLSETYKAMKALPRFRGTARTYLSNSLLTRACLGCILELEHMDPAPLFPAKKRHIRAACLFRWLSRVRPVQIPRKRATADEMEANALFALVGALSELQMGEVAFIQSDWLWACLKVSAYGDIHPESWAIFFGVLEERYPPVMEPEQGEPAVVRAPHSA